jgi:cytochrome c
MEETMKVKIINAYCFAILLFGVPEGYADDVSEGKDFFVANCMGCHAFSCNKEGPSLGGLFGRKSGSEKSYDGYSDGLKNYDVVWDENTLDEFLKDPSSIVLGSMAQFGKIDDADQRLQLIAFLKSEDPSINLCPS